MSNVAAAGRAALAGSQTVGHRVDISCTYSKTNSMADLLVHFGVFDDSRRIALRDELVAPWLSGLMDRQRQVARLGALTRGAHRWATRVLEQSRAGAGGAEQVAAEQRPAGRLAFALGGITHYAADKITKPIMSRIAKMDWHQAHFMQQIGKDDAEKTRLQKYVSTYYDIEVLRRVYLGGKVEPFNQYFMADHTEPEAKVLEDLIGGMFQRALLACHTLSPDEADVDQWLDNLLDGVQPLYIDIRRYVEVFTHPDPQLRKQLETDEFYRPEDPAVQLAEQLRQGIQQPQSITDRITAAISPRANLGGYGQSLALALTRLRETSAYLAGQGELPELRQ